jgi:hypothetical protein
MVAGLRRLFEHVVKRNAEDLEDYLASRLVETMIIRHKRILYRRSRQDRWAISQTQYTAKLVETPRESREPRSSDSTPLIQEPKKFTGDPGSTHGQNMTPVRDKATTVDVGIYRKVTARSRLSRASSAPLKLQDHMLIPPLPRVTVKKQEFVCPYCCLILQSSEVCDRTNWV